jgi:hypothetical protein
MRIVAACLAPVALALPIACGDGSVPRYALCTTADTCPSSTTCEAPAPRVQTFCTAACTSSHDCPNDGVCTSDVGPSATPFCYQPCPSDGCPEGACVSAVATDTSIAKVCVPGFVSALASTSWTSATLATQAMNAAITASSYSVTFASGELSPDAVTATGAFSATFTQTYSASSPSVYAACTETTTFTGGTWSTTNGATAGAGTLAVTGATGSTDRTGCASATKNTTALTNVYDAVINGSAMGGAPFSVQNGTLTISGGAGALPYSDKVDWTFAKK